MLVRIIKDNKNNNWQVISLTGPLYRQVIATAEGVRLTSARFQANSITGHLTSLHGAEVKDAALEDNRVALALGINGHFKPSHHEAVHDERNTGWFDAKTKETLEGVRSVTVMLDSVHYSTDADIAADRQGYTPATTLVPPPSKGLLSKIKNVIGG